ncbi:MAG: aldo/keto reductase [Prevotellaceae bacterium]|jgi:predicted aldo/keto reductase-like oxidoreductase|nr:aldo/keto reductase [Prevotellaceae bacterium]
MSEKKINRRDFLKIAGITTATTTAAMYGCAPKAEKALDLNTSTPVPKGKMTYRTQPKSKDKVSLLGYGCMRYPTVPNPNGEGDLVDQDAVNELVDYAIEHGVNFFDTAPVYVQGFSETATGIALKRHPREKFFVSTKMSNFRDYSYEASVKLYKQSFKNLQVETIDYYFLHSVGKSGDVEFRERFIDNGVLDFLLKEREAGRIRHLGFSFHGTQEGFDFAVSIHEKVYWDFAMIQLNYVDWKHATTPRNVNADYLYAELKKQQIPTIVMEPLLGGRLSKVSDYVLSRFKQRNPEDSVASWAFRFAGTPENVLTVLSGMTYMEHLRDNIRTYSPLVPLTADEKEFLEETAKVIISYPTIDCTDCKYCMPCPYGIDIPAVLLHYNKCVNEGHIIDNPKNEEYKKSRRAFLVGYERSVPKLRQAKLCIGCDICIPTCPQSINIPEELFRIDRFVEHLKQTEV